MKERRDATKPFTAAKSQCQIPLETSISRLAAQPPHGRLADDFMEPLLGMQRLFRAIGLSVDKVRKLQKYPSFPFTRRTCNRWMEAYGTAIALSCLAKVMERIELLERRLRKDG